MAKNGSLKGNRRKALNERFDVTAAKYAGLVRTAETRGGAVSDLPNAEEELLGLRQELEEIWKDAENIGDYEVLNSAVILLNAVNTAIKW